MEVSADASSMILVYWLVGWVVGWVGHQSSADERAYIIGRLIEKKKKKMNETAERRNLEKKGRGWSEKMAEFIWQFCSSRKDIG